MPPATVIISEGFQLDAAAALAARFGLDVLVVPPLNDLAPDGPALQRLRLVEGDMIVVAGLYPRAAYWLLRAHGINGRLGQTTPLSLLGRGSGGEGVLRSKSESASPRTIWCLDLRQCGDPESLAAEVARILAVGGPTTGAGRVEVLEADASVLPRWYPVIDYDACTNCLECLNFCLFGVFGLDEAGRIMVELPDACRNGCPACARVCPSLAILFPVHGDAAIAGGELPPAPLAGDDLDRLVDELDRSEL
ncbi:MAG: ATP-binding protein [Thermoguttaceae bacterium]